MGRRHAGLTRRTALIGGLAASLAACGEVRKDDPAPSAPSASQQIGAATADARRLLAEAEDALSSEFGPLTWEDGDPERAAVADGACRYASATRRCDAYLGAERGDPASIAGALAPVLERNGWPPLPTPDGDPGGWLTATSSRGGLAFTFRSKGSAELSVSGVVAGNPCTVPGASDGG